MLQNWQEQYQALSDFIDTHSEIAIEPGRIRMPDSVRPEFFCYFDAVRMTYIQEKTPKIIEEAEMLSQSYLQVESKVIEVLNLNEIILAPDLDRFLHDPAGQLSRALYDLLFALLKGKIDLEQFDITAMSSINKEFAMLYQSGYEKWVSLSLIKLLEADELLQVILPELSLYDAHKSGGIIKENMPDPEKADKIIFEFAPNTACNIADWIVRSPKTGKYISSRSQFGEPFGIAANSSEKREWYPVESVQIPGEGILMMCQGGNAYEISLFSDAGKVCRSDMLLVCKPFEGWFEREEIDKIINCHKSLKPLLGTFVISMGSSPQVAPEAQVEGITLLPVGLDENRLQPVIEALVK